MDKKIEIIKKTRTSLLGIIQDLTMDQLNEVPEGFNNNIAWNLGHLVASQQGLCYTRAGLPLVIDQQLHDRYKPGTRPQQVMDSDEFKLIKEQLISTMDRFEADQKSGLFTNYSAWTNRYGIVLENIDEVVSYVIFHEGLHFGYVTALKRMVSK